MSTIITKITAVELAAQYTNCAINTGMLEKKCASLAETVNSPEAEDQLSTEIVDLFERLALQKATNDEMFNQVNLVDELTQPLFKAQTVVIGDSFSRAEDCAKRVYYAVYNKELDKIYDEFDRGIEVLNCYNNNPTEENTRLMLIDTPAAIFKRISVFESINHLRRDKRAIEIDSTKFKQQINHVKRIYSRFEKLIENYAPGTLGHLFKQLESACSDSNLSPEDKFRLQQKIEDSLAIFLPEEIQNTIDGEIYHRSPEPKGGDKWGRLHRYDDLNRFKDAFLTAYSTYIEKQVLEVISQKDLPQFYKIIHEDTFGPADVNHGEWVKSQFPLVKNFISDAIKEILEGNHEREALAEAPPLDLPFDETPPDSPIKLEESLNRLEAQMHKLRQDSQPNLDVVSEMISQMFIEPQDPIDQLVNKLHNLAQAGREPDIELVKDMISQMLSEELRNELYGQIYALATDKQEGIYNWGELHCADQMPRLFAALENVKNSIAS